MTALVGGLTLPIPAGATNSRLADTTVDGLLDYLAFWLKTNLDAKFAVLKATGADACPTANRFAFNPGAPRGHYINLRLPALYVWPTGKSVRKRATIRYDHRVRTIQALYVFEEPPDTDGWALREGIYSAVDATFFMAADRGRHASYGYSGAANGTAIWSSLGLREFDYIGGEAGRFGPDGAGERRTRDAGMAFAPGEDYPAWFGSFYVEERVEADTPSDPADVAGDYVVDISTNEQGDPNDTFVILQGFAPGPDGTEQDD